MHYRYQMLMIHMRRTHGRTRSEQGSVQSYSLDMPECLMLLNTIDTSSMHSISSLLDTITHLTPGAQRKARGDDLAAKRRQRIVRERETERERERVCVCVDTVKTQWVATLVIQLRETERERVHRRRSDDDGCDVLMSTRHT